jgi:hypothetical protein
MGWRDKFEVDWEGPWAASFVDALNSRENIEMQRKWLVLVLSKVGGKSASSLTGVVFVLYPPCYELSRRWIVGC